MIDRLFRPVDNASLILFRIVFGLILVVHLLFDLVSGNVKYVWAEATFHLSYFGFAWLPAWSADMMYVHFLFTAVFAGFITIGLRYRLASLLFFLSYAYIFFIERAAYQDQLYFFLSVGFLILFLPLDRGASLDVKQGRTANSRESEAWTLWIVRFQVGLVYVFSGIAKINSDWFDGEPVRIWLSRWSDYNVSGSYANEEWLVYFFVYGILLFELFIIPALLWRKTRTVAFGAVIFFDLANTFVFKAGPFPLILLVLTFIFVDPDSVRRVVGKVVLLANRILGTNIKLSQSDSELGASIGSADTSVSGPPGARRIYLIAGLSIFVFIQITLPMRAFLYPGNPAWTDEGQHFSWRMMFRDKLVTDATILIHDPDTGGNTPVNPDEHMDPWKSVIVFRDPELIRQFAWIMAEEARKGGVNAPRVHAQIIVSLNGRPARSLVDPTVNLAGQRHTFGPADWILPLEDE